MAELRRLEPPASLRERYSRMLGSLEALIATMQAQTQAAAAGARARTVAATARVEEAIDDLGLVASDVGAFPLCALARARAEGPALSGDGRRSRDAAG